MNELLLLVTDNLFSQLSVERLHLGHELQIFIFSYFKLILKRSLLCLRIQKGFSQHIRVVTESSNFSVHLLNVITVKFINFAVMQGLLLEIVDLCLQIFDLLIFLQFKLLRVDLVSEVFELTHNHSHVTAIRIQKILL